jgi:predicted nuclease of predicted toxin-antitoxin system
MAIRFHLDENRHNAIAQGLRQRGVDVTTTADVGMIGASDRHQLTHAAASSRVLVTHDDDLLRLHHQGVSHAGIVFCRQRQRRIGELVLSLTRLWRERDELRDQVVFL